MFGLEQQAYEFFEHTSIWLSFFPSLSSPDELMGRMTLRSRRAELLVFGVTSYNHLVHRFLMHFDVWRNSDQSRLDYLLSCDVTFDGSLVFVVTSGFDVLLPKASAEPTTLSCAYH